MSENVCEDYACEGGLDHTHVGIQPHLRRVVDQRGVTVDGATGEPAGERPEREPDPKQ